MESKEMKSKETNWFLIILGVFVFVLIVYGLIPDISKIIFNPANQNMPKIISSFSYKKELKEAKRCASRPGLANMMEEHLIKAEWDAKKKGVNISEKVKEIYAMGSCSVLELALSRAIYGHTDSASYDLIRYKRFCLEAEIQPDDERIEKVEMIIRRN